MAKSSGVPRSRYPKRMYRRTKRNPVSASTSGYWIEIALLAVGLIGSWSAMKVKHDRLAADVTALWIEFREHVKWSGAKVSEMEERFEARYVGKEYMTARLDDLKARLDELNRRLEAVDRLVERRLRFDNGTHEGHNLADR